MRLSIFFPVLIALICLTASISYSLKPEREYRAIPSDYGIIYEDVTFKTADGLSLKGWFFPAQDASGIANNIIGRVIPVPQELKCKPREYNAKYQEKRATIIICDGDGGNMTYFIFYAYHFFAKGYNVFTFDWRGFGGSSDWPVDQDLLCYSEFLTDYDAAIDYIKRRPEVDTAKIGVLGFSTGAYLSFGMAVKRNDIAVYCGRALMTSFNDLVPIVNKLDSSRTFKAPVDYPAELLPINSAKSMNKPAYLIVGEKDVRTPSWMSENIFKLLKGPKELWIVPGAEHGGRNGPDMYNYPEFFVRVGAFFDKYLIVQK
ncbi:MAG: alpha/beta hydrolase [Bacteroidota bacterium]